MSKNTAIGVYVRVSSNHQDTELQEHDLRKWAEVHATDQPIQWYRDKATGKNMDRPSWQALETAIGRHEVSAIVVWRLDRLGRTASGLTKLFDNLLHEGVNLVSLKDSLDLSTAAGRLMANVLASVAQYETEVRGERVRAGIARAKANGKRWGGSKRGHVRRKNEEKIAAALEMFEANKPVVFISQVTGLSRAWIYQLIDRKQEASQ